jgi:YD repeat-containing protein
LRETTTYSYNAINGVISVQDGNGHTTSFQYDLLGNRIKLTDANNHVTTFTRPNTLDTVTTCDPANNCTILNKDAMNRRSIFTDKRGVKDVYT